MQGSPADLAESKIDYVQFMGMIEDQMETIESIEKPASRKLPISSSKSNSFSHSKCVKNDEKDDGVQMEESSKGKIEGSVAWGYFSAGAHWIVLVLLAVTFPIVDIFASGSDYWMSIWYVNLGFLLPISTIRKVNLYFSPIQD